MGKKKKGSPKWGEKETTDKKRKRRRMKEIKDERGR